MDDREADLLMADLLTVTSRLDKLLKSERPLTALQRDCLSNAHASLKTFFIIQKTHY
jgi:hypothetical protein